MHNTCFQPYRTESHNSEKKKMIEMRRFAEELLREMAKHQVMKYATFYG